MTKYVRRSLLQTVVAVSVISLAAVVAPGAQQKPTLTGGIAIDFRALSANGQPVTDLQPADVSVKIAGKVRTVSGLEYVKLDSGAGTAAGASTVPAPFTVNTASNGRNFVILVDNESLKAGTEREMREALDVVLNGLGPNDRVAFSVAPRDTFQIGLGAGLPAVRAALLKYQGIRAADPSPEDSACRTRDSLVLLRAMLEPFVGSETPTSVLFIAGGLILPNRGTGAVQPRCEVTLDHYQAIGVAAATARINLYVAQGDEAVTGRDGGLENLAGVGNSGAVMRAVDNGLARILPETSGYYVATVSADPADRPGSVQRLELKVNKESVTTRARTDVALIGRSGGGSAKATPRDMVATTAPFTGLQLRTSVVPSRGAEGKIHVLTLTEPVEPGVKLTAATAVIIAPGANKAAFVRSANDKELAGKPLLLGLSADAGKYRVRVAATDDKGRAGAVDIDVDAGLTPAGPLQLGQMLLLGPRGESFAPQMQFTDEAEIAVMFELYGPVATNKIGAKVDIASAADGKSLVEGQVGGAPTSDPDRFQLNAKLAIGKLPPGDYVIRATVQAEGHPEGKVTRTLRKVAK